MNMKLKTEKEIEILAEGGHILAEILAELAKMCQPGVTAAELDIEAEKRIRAAGGEPSFKNFGPLGSEFPASLCVSPNEMVVHGIPYKHLIFKDGDLVGLDLGMKYKNLFTDHAVTIPIGKISPEAAKLIIATKECLRLGIEAARPGNRLGDIGYAVQKYAEDQGYGVVRSLTGHAVGYAVHEEPRVPNYGEAGKGEELKVGAVLAIEPMINLGTHEVKTADDGWGIITADKKLSAHFEHTIAITKNGPRILTL
ncbi:MAG: type I methionyl aminopeptidase [Candidatus Komeilibacteria bacterium]|nr:type I methionyl aminopeptidase [Candidatus Komeilibacteria bacterium]